MNIMKKSRIMIGMNVALLSIAIGLGACNKPDDAPEDPVNVTDIDGNTYGVVRIGTQLWTTENLKTTKYNDGTSIATGLSNATWASTTTGAYAIYGDNNANNSTYGKLYNWHAVNTGKLAPAGWHVPTRADWELMIDYLGGSSVAGGKMKSTSSLWTSPNLGANNSSKFSALPSGWKAANSGNYDLINESAYWWAATQSNATQGRYVRVDDDLAGAAASGADKESGYAVRLVKD